MSSDNEKDKYNVISENNEYAVESNGEEIIYEEYIDADQIVEGYTEDGEVVYYTEDGVFEEIILGDDSDVMYEEIIYGDGNLEKSEDVVFIEKEQEPEKVILGDGSDEEKNEENKIDSKNNDNTNLKKKVKEKEDKINKNNENSKKDNNDKAILDKKVEKNNVILKDDKKNDEVKKEVNLADKKSVHSNIVEEKILTNNSTVNSTVSNVDSNMVNTNGQSNAGALNNNIQPNVVSNNIPVSNNVVNNNASSVDLNMVNTNGQSNVGALNNNIQQNVVSNNVPVSNNIVNNNTSTVGLNTVNTNFQSNAGVLNNNIQPNVVPINSQVQSISANVNNNGMQFNYNNQNTTVSKSVFTQEEKDSLLSDEKARLENEQFIAGNNKSVPVVEINLENSKSSLGLNSSGVNNSVYNGNPVMSSNQSTSNNSYQIPGQVNSNMSPQATMMYQNQMHTMRPMNNFVNSNQQVITQPQIINSQPMAYQAPVMNTVYQTAIPVATSGVMPPSNMNYQTNAQPMMQAANTQAMYQSNSNVYGAQNVRQMGNAVYPNNAMPQVPRVNPYQAMKPATQATKTTSNSDKSIYKKNHGFLKFLFLLIFLAIVGFFVYVIFFRQSNYNGKANLNSLYDPLKLIPIYDGELLGYANYNGEIKITPSYSTGSDFYGDFAVVSKDEKYEIINKAGESVVKAQEGTIPFYDMYYDVWIIDNKLYSHEMNLLFSNIKDVSNGFYSYIDSNKGEVGIVNNTGKVLYSCLGTNVSFETMETFFNDTYALVKVEGTDDVIISGKTGEVIYKGLGINIKDNNIFSLNFNGITKFIYVFDGKVVKEFEGVSDVNMFNFSKKILQVTNLDGNNVYYDSINNTEVTTAETGELFYAKEYYGYEIIKKESESGVKYDLIKDGESVLETTYDSISFLEPELHEFVKVRTLKEFVILTLGDTVQLYDLTFKKKFVELQNVDVSSGGTFVIFTAKKDSTNKEDTIYNLLTDMETKFTTGEKEYIAGSNYVIAVDKNNNASYYNIKVKNIHETSKFPR